MAKANWTRCCFDFFLAKREFNSSPRGDMLDFISETAQVQKIEELERQNAGLEQDLELLRSSEHLGGLGVEVHAEKKTSGSYS